MIKFAYTILYVEDVAKSLKFYEDAFDFKTRILAPDYGDIDGFLIEICTPIV